MFRLFLLPAWNAFYSMAATVERVVVDVSVAVAKALQRAAGAARDVSVSFCTSMWHRVVMPLSTFALDHVISPAARTGRALWSAGVRACNQVQQRTKDIT